MANIKKNGLMLAAVFGGLALAEAKTDVTVELKSGDSKKVTVEDDGFIVFTGDQMGILPTATATSTENYPLADVKKLLFKDLTGTARILKEGEIALYPTIATTQVNLANATNEIGNVQIIDMEGKIVLNTAFEAGQPINISQLATGWYTLKAGNATFKFVKK